MINWVLMGSWVAVLAVTVLLIFFYAAKGTGVYIYFSVFLGYFLAFAIVGLVPYDIYVAQHSSEDDTELSNDDLYIFWQSAYWLSFTLCWLLLPILQQYEISGSFTWKSRLLRSACLHFRSLLLAGILGILFLLLLILQKGASFLPKLPSILTSLSNIWGLFLIILFLSYGIIAVPRTLWNLSYHKDYLDFLYVKLSNIDEDVMNAMNSLDEAVKSVCVLEKNSGNTAEISEKLLVVVRLCPAALREVHKGKIGAKSGEKLKEDELVKAHCNLKNSLAEYKRAKNEWTAVVKEVVYYEDLVEAKESVFKRVLFTLEGNQKTQQKCCKTTKQCALWYWLVWVKPILFRILAALCAIMSLLVVLGESTLFIKLPLGVFPLIIQMDFGPIFSQLLCMLPLSYIVFCTYYAFFNLKLPGLYGLYRSNTDPSSLVYCAYYLSRLSAPLAYNFFMFVKVQNTTFSKVVSSQNLVLIDQLFIFFPLLIVLFSLLNYINAYGRVLNLIGINQLSFIDSSMSHKLQEGKNICKREKLRLKRTLAHDSSALATWEMTNMELLKDSGYSNALIN